MTPSGNLFSQSPLLLKNKCMHLHLSSLAHLSNKPSYLFISSFPLSHLQYLWGHSRATSTKWEVQSPPACSSFQVNPGSGPSLWHWGLKQQFQSWSSKPSAGMCWELFAINPSTGVNAHETDLEQLWRAEKLVKNQRLFPNNSQAGRKGKKKKKGKTLGISCLL